MRAIFRFFGFLFFTLWYLTPILIRAAFRGTDLSHALAYRKKWARVVTRVLGLRLREKGIPAFDGSCVYIGNHRSYTDPVIALREIKSLPVAKAEVSSWPLIGFAARATGIMFVKRESSSSRRDTLGAMHKCLEDGFPVLIYPEGTTHTDPQTIPFRKGAFSLAAKYNYPVVPIAIEYGSKGDAWVGDDTFIPHFMRTFGKRKTDVWIKYGDPIYGTDPNELVEKSQAWIDTQLMEFQMEREQAVATI